MKSLWLLVFWASLSFSLSAMPAQIIVIRHGEKPKDRDAKHLSAAGRKRAERLVEFVKDNPEVTRFGPPTALVAAHPTKDGGGQRTGETLEPISKELNLPINMPYQSEHSKKLADWILSTKGYDAKTVLVCWTHEHIPELIEALGVHPAPEKVPDDAYDRVYVIRYGDKNPSLEVLHQDMPSAPAGKESKLHHIGKKGF